MQLISALMFLLSQRREPCGKGRAATKREAHHTATFNKKPMGSKCGDMINRWVSLEDQIIKIVLRTLPTDSIALSSRQPFLSVLALPGLLHVRTGNRNKTGRQCWGQFVRAVCVALYFLPRKTFPR